MSYQLTNVEDRHAEAPDTFQIRPREDRENLKIGDFAKLIFDEAERMWVRVTAYENGHFKGALNNTPVQVNLELGQEIEFGPEHITDIMRGP